MLAQGDADPGTHESRWSAAAGPGLYFVRLRMRGETRVAKLVLAR
jgi:hypothetical protein